MKRCTPRGFTLFELMLALGLSVVLLAAITSALQLYWSYSTAGRERMEQSQLARAIIEKIQLDVRSVVFRQPNPLDLQIVNSQTAADAGETTRVEVARDKEQYLAENVGIVGDGQRLLLHINRSARISRGDATNAADRSGIQFVAWFVADRGQPGLARRTADATAINRDNSQSALVEFASGRIDGSVIAEEVSSVRFRYWDGKEWLAAWDSIAAKALPRAVEVAIGFGRREPELNDDNRYRSVIPIGISEPQPPSIPESQLQ